MAGEHNDWSKSNAQAEETLRNGSIPNLSFENFFPLRSDEVGYSISCARQSAIRNEKGDEANVREQGSHIGYLP